LASEVERVRPQVSCCREKIGSLSRTSRGSVRDGILGTSLSLSLSLSLPSTSRLRSRLEPPILLPVGGVRRHKTQVRCLFISLPPDSS